MNSYQPRGTCSRMIQFEVTEEGTLHDVRFEGGCNGNLQGIGALVEGMEVQEAIDRLAGIQCGFKGTSCPDQLAQALIEYQEEH